MNPEYNIATECSPEQPGELKTLILKLWDKAVGTPDYDKSQWKRLQFLIQGK
jgi:hypothetical protein